MSEELKPCPFCGGEAGIRATNKKYGFDIWCECKKCNVRTDGYCPDTNKEESAIENIEKCKNRVAEIWNRRANDEAD